LESEFQAPNQRQKSGFQQRVINQRIDLHRHHQCHQHHHRRHQQLQLPRLTAHSLHRHIIIIQTAVVEYPLSIITTTILPRLAAHSLTIHSSTATLMAVVMIILVVVSNQLSSYYSTSTTTTTAISVV